MIGRFASEVFCNRSNASMVFPTSPPRDKVRPCKPHSGSRIIAWPFRFAVHRRNEERQFPLGRHGHLLTVPPFGFAAGGHSLAAAQRGVAGAIPWPREARRGLLRSLRSPTPARLAPSWPNRLRDLPSHRGEGHFSIVPKHRWTGCVEPTTRSRMPSARSLEVSAWLCALGFSLGIRSKNRLAISTGLET